MSFVRLVIPIALFVGACGDDGGSKSTEPPRPESTSTDASLRAETITISGVRYLCIVYEKFQVPGGGGLWCREVDL